MSTSSKRTAGRRPKSGAHGCGTRAQILNAARSIFAQKGLNGTSVREVAESARVNNAMIYYHFSDKVELYRAVLSDSFAAYDRIWDHGAFKASTTARRKIQQYAESLIRLQQSHEELRRILSMEFACCGKNIKWLSENFFQHHYEKLSEILEEGMRSGELKKIDPAYAVTSLVSMIVHAFIIRPVAENVIGRKLDLTAKRFGTFATGLFFDGIAKERS